MTCSRCGSSKSSFGLTFFGGTCSACMSHAELYDTSVVNENRGYIEKLFDDSKTKSKGNYHCIVPIRGDAEDYFTLKYLLSKGLDPLVVHVNNFFQNEIGWANVHNLITFFDVDSVSFSPNYETYRNLVAASLRKIKSIYAPYKGIQHSYVMRLAAEKNIPLVVWGQCQPLEFSGKFSRRDRLFQSKWWVSEHELNGLSPEQFLSTGVALSDNEASIFKYPDRSEVAHVKSIFLSNFLFWDQVSQGSEALSAGYVPQRQVNTYDFYENAGSSVYYQVHDLLRLLNCGFPKVYEHLSRDIRFNRISIEQARPVRRGMDKYLAYDISLFFSKFLGVTSSGYQWFVEKRLEPLRHLLRAAPERNLSEDVVVPPEMVEGYPVSSAAKNEFVVYMKGI